MRSPTQENITDTELLISFTSLRISSILSSSGESKQDYRQFELYPRGSVGDKFRTREVDNTQHPYPMDPCLDHKIRRADLRRSFYRYASSETLYVAENFDPHSLYSTSTRSNSLMSLNIIRISVWYAA